MQNYKITPIENTNEDTSYMDEAELNNFRKQIELDYECDVEDL